ncbi:MAG TPA: ABC transporter substrate-binding protein [Clostridia bacterium]
MKFQSKLFLVIITVVMLVSVSGCYGDNPAITSEEASSKGYNKIVLGFSQIGDESEWRSANTESIKAAARKEGIELIFSNALQKQENQIEAIRTFINQRVDAIAFSPIVETGWDPVLNEAKAAGIPVFLTDRTIKTKDDSLYVTCIGSDFKNEGEKAGKWLLDKMKNVKRQINIVEIEGTYGSTPSIGRMTGFEEAVRKNPNMNILYKADGDFMRSKGKEIMEDFLNKKGSRIDAVFAHNDDMALGAIEAIEEHGQKPGTDIVIVSVDAVREAFEAMIEGKLNCTVECNPLLGPQLIKTTKDYFNGKQIPKRIVIEEGIFPQETAVAEVGKRKY